MANLSKASIYEQTFGVRHRRAGRPADGEVLFPAGDADPVLANVAKRRAYAVVHEESRDRLQELFVTELRVLRRRGVEQVAEDLGIDLKRGGEPLGKIG